MIGHALFGAGIQYGLPLFWIISPSSRHSGLVVRLSRYLQNDPYVSHENSKGYGFREWIAEDSPRLMQKKNEEGVVIELPA